MGRKIFIDCGGHCGCTRRLFRDKFDTKKEFEIFSFEADPELAKYCPDLISKAAWVEDTIMDFFKFEMRGGSSLIEERAKRLAKQPGYENIQDVIKVECFDLDRWIKECFEPTDIIWLKLDVEGAEYTILPHMIKNGSIKYINRLFIEWHCTKMGLSKQVNADLTKQIGIPTAHWDAMLAGYCFIRGKITK